MTLFRIPATSQFAKIAALAGAKVCALKEHYELGRGVFSAKANDKVSIMYCGSKWMPAGELSDYFDAIPICGYFVCDKDVSHLMDCKPLEITKEFATHGTPPLTLTAKDDFKNVGGSFDLGERVTAASLRAVASIFIKGAEWIETNVTGKVAPASPSLFKSVTMTNTRKTVTITGSSFIREISFQENYKGFSHTLGVRFLKADGVNIRQGAIVYAIPSKTNYLQFVAAVDAGGSAGQYYNSFVKGLPVVENTLETIV